MAEENNSTNLDQEHELDEQNVEAETETHVEEQSADVDVEQLQRELDEAKAQIDAQKDSVLRAKAEVENARRRADTEVEKARKFALERFAGELLSVIDNLERAMAAANPEEEAVKALFDGIEMTHKGFLDTVMKFGMEEVNPVNEMFNPDLHQAMSMQESEEHKPNSVIAVMQKGYTLNGRLLRPAMVMVARAAQGNVDTQA